jgi:putative tricarboxylic transport membrane protein
MPRDLACSAVLLAIAGGYYAAASGIGRSALADEVGPSGLPIVYSILLAVLALIIGVQAILQSILRARAAATEPVPSAFDLRRAAGVAGIGVAYVVVVPFLGYVATLALAISATAALLGVRPSVRLVAYATAGAAVFWLLFTIVLGVPMPSLGSG